MKGRYVVAKKRYVVQMHSLSRPPYDARNPEWIEVMPDGNRTMRFADYLDADTAMARLQAVQRRIQYRIEDLGD